MVSRRSRLGPFGALGSSAGQALKRTEARLLIVGLVVVGAIFGFAGLAGEVREGDVFSVDRIILMAFRVPGHPDIAIGPRWVQESARDITALGGFTVLTLVTLAAIVLLAMHGRRAQATVFAVTVIVAQLASGLLKTHFDRPRPTVVPALDLVYSSSFPSGHAMMTPVVYLSLAAIVAAGEHQTSLKVLVLTSAASLVLAVGVSRVYLGVHWPTDVLAGWALGIAIALSASVALYHVVAPKRPTDPL